jgi:glycosyltransferase involved in cell wall biosynthesis
MGFSAVAGIDTRTVHVNTSTLLRGGERQTLLLLTGLRNRGAEPLLVAQPRSELAREALSRKLPVQLIPMRGEWDLLAARRIAGLLEEGEKKAILHAHTSHAHGLAAILRFAGKAATTVVTRRTVFPIHTRSLLPFCRWKYFSGADRYIAISEAVRNALTAGGVPPSKISIVRSGIETKGKEPGDAGKLRRDFGIGAGGPVVGSVGSLAAEKGHVHLVRAMPAVLSAHPGARFVIVGEGECRNEIRRAAEDLGVAGRLLLPGYRVDVADWLALFDLFVMPSLEEGLGTAVLEAMGAGLPVVASDTGGLRETVRPGKTGLLVPPADAAALAEAIGFVLANPETARSFGAEGRRVQQSEYTAAAMVEGTLDVYGQCSAHNGKPA